MTTSSLTPRLLRLAGLALGLALTACGGGGSGDGIAAPPMARVEEPVQPAVASAPFGKALGDCTFNAARTTACQLTTLPFLGQETTEVLTVEKVMERVATSHPWMAQRMRESLASQPPELLQMFRPITAIIIGSKVRPSFYQPATGAIYLDPDFLWLTQAERATISKDPDERIGFGSELQFRAIWRYVRNNQDAYAFFPESFSGTRTNEDTRIALGRLLVHELAHAGDFSPPKNLASLSRQQTVEQAINAQSGNWISTQLNRTSPLTSRTWESLGQVLFANKTPTTEEKGYTPAQAGALIEPDRASDAYGYFSRFEDLAMMSEELLGYCFYGIQRDFATSNRPASGEQLIVGWGVRGRIAEPAVQQAVRFVTNELLPGVNLDSCYAALPAPVMMRAGASWASNLDPSGNSGDVPKAEAAAEIRLDNLLPPG